MNGRVWFGIIVTACLAPLALSTERLPMSVKINGQPAQLAIDTGSERTCLFDTTARRLGLQVTAPPPDVTLAPGQVAMGRTQECTLEIGDSSVRGRLRVVTLPGYLKPGIDGVIGWDILSGNVVEIQGPARRIRIHDQRTLDVSQWDCWAIRPGAKRLVVQIPAGPNEPNAVLIDSGAPGGVYLSSRRWRRWVEAHPDRPATLDASFMPGIGLVVSEERWAHELPLGGLILREVPVCDRMPVVEVTGGTEYAATLGLFVLRRLSLVIDGAGGKVYLKSHAAPEKPNRYDYNRLGAVFVPADAGSEDLVAHVVEPGPAHEADVRNGDILLRIGDLDVTKWRTDPRVLPLSRFWSRPAGTVLQLGLKRNGQDLNLAVALRNIFPD